MQAVINFKNNPIFATQNIQTTRKFTDLSDVDLSNLQGGASLVYNAITKKFEFTMIGGISLIDGGTF